ncbi:MAG TPA: class I SAM-dependent methyltransferase [Herpetosiphonaceae bacterium]
MVHVHRQPWIADYRLRMPRSVHYTLAAGGAAVALGVGSRVGTSANRKITGSLIGAGSAVLVPTLALVGFVHLLQTARDRLRDTIVEGVSWRGDERVLDVGTGSGILLFACAKHLRTGTATGIDIYDPNAGGGSAEIFWRNARAEGIADRVELLNVDARRMTFTDEMFDVVVSSLAMHHVGAAQDRQRATSEIIRILKPGGSIAICDLTAVLGESEDVLRKNGMLNIRRRPYMRLFSILTAEKP